MLGVSRLLSRRTSSTWMRLSGRRMCTSEIQNDPKVRLREQSLMAKAFEPLAVEKGWMEWWRSQHLFSPEGTTVDEQGKGWDENDSENPHTQSFSLLFPPPNVTGKLHIGHALTLSLQDSVLRFQRMRSRHRSRDFDSVSPQERDSLPRWVLQVPGQDHAGIATQAVVERHLLSTRNLDRLQLGREGFVDEIWKWKNEHGDIINSQIDRLGASMDADRRFFTLDEKRSEAVFEAFCRLHRSGLLYRQRRLVHWSSKLMSAVSDLEVEPLSVTKRTLIEVVGQSSSSSSSSPQTKRKLEVGVIHTIRYPIANKPPGETREFVEVATTRPETIPGDVALVVHPEDARYQSLWRGGATVLNPLTGKQIPIVTDAELVDPEKGTGVVKLTPSHDENDWAAAQRLGLSFFHVFDPQGRLSLDLCGPTDDLALSSIAPSSGFSSTQEMWKATHGELQGMDRLLARSKVVQILQTRDLYSGAQDFAQTINMCSRSGDVLEPVPLPQWFIKCAGSDGLAVPALEALRSKDLSFTPSSFAAEWNRWLSNTRDWCISRQLWWGHRIPAYRLKTNANPENKQSSLPVSGWPVVGESLSSGTLAREEEEEWFVGRSKEEAAAAASQKLGRNVDPKELEQDEDVLDTWFSSALLPLSALGWPDVSASDLRRFYPLHAMETGSDILFFWVARMVMLCQHLSEGNVLPFHRVWMHPLVRDREGRKMSKSLGNVIDPLLLLDGCSLNQLVEPLQKSNLSVKEIQKATKSLQIDFASGVPTCGADALRFAMADYMQQDIQIHLDINRVITYRFFCNKVWNASRFVMSALTGGSFDRSSSINSRDDLFVAVAVTPSHSISVTSLGPDHPRLIHLPSKKEIEGHLAERWMMSHMSRMISKVSLGLSRFDVSESTQALYHIFLDRFCDVYLEYCKLMMQDQSFGSEVFNKVPRRVLVSVVEIYLRLLHPFMPFLTEELWQNLTGARFDPLQSITIQPFPLASEFECFLDEEAEVQFQVVIDIIHAVRSLRSTYNISKSQKLEGLKICVTGRKEIFEIVKAHLPFLQGASLCPLIALQDSPLTIVPPKTGFRKVNAECSVYLSLEGQIDVKEEVARQTSRQQKLIVKIDTVRKRIANPDYAARVPLSVQESDKRGLETLEQELTEIGEILANLVQ